MEDLQEAAKPSLHPAACTEEGCHSALEDPTTFCGHWEEAGNLLSTLSPEPCVHILSFVDNIHFIAVFVVPIALFLFLLFEAVRRRGHFLSVASHLAWFSLARSIHVGIIFYGVLFMLATLDVELLVRAHDIHLVLMVAGLALLAISVVGALGHGPLVPRNAPVDSGNGNGKPGEPPAPSSGGE